MHDGALTSFTHITPISQLCGSHAAMTSQIGSLIEYAIPTNNATCTLPLCQFDSSKKLNLVDYLIQ